MNKWSYFPGLLSIPMLGLLLIHPYLKDAQAASLAGEKTLVLYDPASGGIPSESLLDFTDFPPGAALPTYSGGATVLDTTLSGSGTYAGWVSGERITPDFPVLDRAEGIRLTFTLQVEAEIHSKANRAGLSVILLDQGAKGIELSFWEDEIWAQNDGATGGLFTHGEGIALATTAGLKEYQLSIAGDTYTLTAGSQPLLSGPVRDYSAFEGFLDPYETPNFLFLGDNTTSAQARARLGFVSITGAEPLLPTVTSIATGTGSPLPTATFTPAPSATPFPLPTPAPAGGISELCSSGWLFLAVAVTGTLLSRRSGR